MQSKAKTVSEYLKSLPEDRRRAVAAVRKVIRANLDPRYQEGMQYGMIGYYVPLSVFPAGYLGDPTRPMPFAALASQKNHLALYLMSVYGDSGEARWFRETWAKTGKKLDMGKSCVRFKRAEDLPLEVIGEAIRRTPARTYLQRYEQLIKSRSRRKT
jgi:hypothetical protein